MKKLYSPDDLIAHSDAMQLIDEVYDYGPDWIECLVYHKEGASFSNEKGEIPSWIGLEYMCQTVAAHEGILRLEVGREICIGFVIGCRKYQAYTPNFHIGQVLRVRAEEEMRNDTDLGVFRCEILDADNNTLSAASIKAFMPENPDTVLEHKRKIR